MRRMTVGPVGKIKEQGKHHCQNIGHQWIGSDPPCQLKSRISDPRARSTLGQFGPLRSNRRVVAGLERTYELIEFTILGEAKQEARPLSPVSVQLGFRLSGALPRSSSAVG